VSEDLSAKRSGSWFLTLMGHDTHVDVVICAIV